MFHWHCTEEYKRGGVFITAVMKKMTFSVAAVNADEEECFAKDKPARNMGRVVGRGEQYAPDQIHDGPVLYMFVSNCFSHQEETCIVEHLEIHQ